VSSVREYYDANTSKFLLFGAEGAIHRELWGPGTSTKAEAVHYVHDLILSEIRALAVDGDARVLDLGCGVGAADRFLAERIPARIYGVSISPRQVAHAASWPRGRTLLGELSFHEADFCALSPSLASAIAPVDLAFAIEAFVHAESAAAFFAQVSRVLRPGGRLILVDDFLEGSGREDRLLGDVRRGWHMHSLLTVAETRAAATANDLRWAGSLDLSSLQRLGRPRDKLVHAIQPLLRPLSRFSPWAESLVGGDALQTCHRRGLLRYQLLRFERTSRR
jgi:SAM-dependent methyltransferase